VPKIICRSGIPSIFLSLLNLVLYNALRRTRFFSVLSLSTPSIIDPCQIFFYSKSPFWGHSFTSSASGTSHRAIGRSGRPVIQRVTGNIVIRIPGNLLKNSCRAYGNTDAAAGAFVRIHKYKSFPRIRNCLIRTETDTTPIPRQAYLHSLSPETAGTERRSHPALIGKCILSSICPPLQWTCG
jgi:hypothetical protein